jgi:hypothetical protein
MTGTMGSSLILIAASTVALVFGWIGASTIMIWLSIGASVAAGFLLGLAFNEARASR